METMQDKMGKAETTFSRQVQTAKQTAMSPAPAMAPTITQARSQRRCREDANLKTIKTGNKVRGGM